MKLASRYILEHLSKMFFSLFIVIFFITSIILSIRIATVTFIIKMNFFDFFELYFYSLPVTMFFALPITFFTACVITLSKLSKEYELPVLFSLGFSPAYFFRIFFPLSLMLSIILFFFSFVLIPSSNELYNKFLNQKKKNIDINLQPAEFAQKLGSWLVYIQSSSDKSYNDVVLFSNKSFEYETFIVADKVNLVAQDSTLEIHIFDGTAYLNHEKSIDKIDYQKMISRIEILPQEQKHQDVIKYWSKINNINLPYNEENRRQIEEARKILKNFSQYILVSLFPLISIALIPLLGIMHPRFNRSYVYFYTIASIALFHGFTHIISTYFPVKGIVPFVLIWCVSIYLLYRKQIAKIF